MEMGERIRDLRVRAGLTKTALARPRYTVSYVSQIEAGRRRPSAEALAFLSSRLGVTPDFLTTGVPDGTEEALRYELIEAGRTLRQGLALDAERLIRGVLARAEEYGLEGMRAQARSSLGDALMLQGKVRQAIDAFEEALEGDITERDRGFTTAALAKAYRSVGDLSYAADLAESYLLLRDRGPLDPGVATELQTVLVSVYFERGDVVRAERAAGRALTAADQGAPPEIRANAYWDASRVMAEARRWDDALDLATRARVLWEEFDDRRRLGRLHTAYGFLCLEADPPRMVEAAEHLDVAEGLFAEASAPGDLVHVFSERSRLALLAGHGQEALAHAERAIANIGPEELELPRCLFLRGRALGALGRLGEARDSLMEAAMLFEKHGQRQQQAGAWREIGELELTEGNVSEALEALRAGLEALDPRRSRA